MERRIGAYQRISTDVDGEGLGVERQRRDTHQLAALRGWTIARDYTDNNLSAFKSGVVRPRFQQMVSDLASGVIDGVVAYDLDRIARRPTDLEALIDVYDRRPGLVFATVQNDIDLSGDGITMARVMIAFANKSSRDTARRVKRKIIENAEQGRPHGSPVRPYGYSTDPMVLDPEEAAVLRDMGEWFGAGYSYYEIAKRLNGAGRVTRAGAPWMPVTIKKLLLNPRNAGFRVVDGVKYRGAWAHVFSDSEWDDLERMRQQRRENRRGRPNNTRYLLTRLVKCARCGSDLGGMTKRDDSTRGLRRTYQCRSDGCGMCVGADALDHLVREAVIYRLDGPLLAEAIAAQSDESGVRELYAELAGLQARKDQLVRDYAEGLLDRGDFAQAKRIVTDHIDSTQLQIDQRRQSDLRVQLTVGQDLRDAWDQNADGWRRELIELLVERIEVRTSTRRPFYDVDGVKHRFDPRRVSVRWKI